MESPSDRIERIDVAIIGGGPAGTATAICLLEHGFSVAILEKSDYDALRVGETFPPEVRALLADLGLWDVFLKNSHRHSSGIVSTWGGDEPYERDFIANPYGRGWHVDRRAFDEMLSKAAQSRGVRVFRKTRVVGCAAEGDYTWRIDTSDEGRKSGLRVRFVVDAAGRSPNPLLRAGTRRIPQDHQISVLTFSQVSPQTPGDDRTIIEAVEEGWWYSAVLPGEISVVALTTDPDLIPHGEQELRERWLKCLARTRLTRQRLPIPAVVLRLRTVASNSYLREPLCGRNLLAVGDAAAAYDPLSGQGVYRALDSARLAAEAIGNHLSGERDALEKYAEKVRADYLEYVRIRAIYYRQERRWPRAPFWSRRHGSVKSGLLVQ